MDRQHVWSTSYPAQWHGTQWGATDLTQLVSSGVLKESMVIMDITGDSCTCEHIMSVMVISFGVLSLKMFIKRVAYRLCITPSGTPWNHAPPEGNSMRRLPLRSRTL